MHQLVLLSSLLLHHDDGWFNKQFKALSNQGDPAAAMKLLDVIEAEAEREKETDWLLYARWKRGDRQARLGDMVQARKTLEQTADLAPKDHPLLYFIQSELGEICLRTFHYADAEAHLQAALDRAQKPIVFRGETISIQEAGLVRVRLLQGECLLSGGNDKEARRRILPIEKQVEKESAEQLAAPPDRRNEDWPCLLVQCEAQLAELDKRDADAFGAIRREERALETLQSLRGQDVPAMEFSCRLGLAAIYRNVVRYHAADGQLDKAEGLLTSLHPEQFKGDLENARAALRIEQISGSLESAGSDTRDLPERLKRAEAAAQGAVDSYAKANPGPNTFTAAALSALAQVHELHGRLHERAGEAKNALQEYRKACDLADESLRQFDAASVPASHDLVLEGRRLRGRLRLKLDDLDGARKDGEEALQQYIKNHDKDNLGCGPYHQLLVEIEDQAHRPAAAAAHAEAHRQLSAEHLVDYLPRLTAPEQVQFFRTWDDPGLHAALRLGIARKGEAASSLCAASGEWLINGKAKAAEVLAAVNLHERGKKDYQEFQRAIAEQAYLLFGPPVEPAAQLRELLEVESRKRDLAAKQDLQAVEKAYKLSDLQRALANDEVYIDVYCLRPEEGAARAYYAWVTTDAGEPTVVPLGSADEIEGLVETFQNHMGLCAVDDRKHNLIATLGHTKAREKLSQDCLKDLSRDLLDPILPLAAGKKRWIVSPDGPLWNLPWAALILPKSGKYAVEDYTFRYVVSGRDLLRPAATRKPGDPWIVADPDLDNAATVTGGKPRPDAVPQLKGARQEGVLVAGRLKPLFKHEPHVLTGEKATKEEFLKLDQAPPPRILYLATHGFASLPKPAWGDDGPQVDPLLGCGVAFAGYNLLPDAGGEKALPGLLTGAEVLAVDLRGTDLVVLAACDSGTGVTLTGQSPADLRHAFHLAGARAVASSLWSVDDQATQDLMDSFMTAYSARPAGDKAEALAEAQRQMLKNPRLRMYAHPYFWAAFTLSGS